MEYPLVTVFTLIYNTNPRYVIEAIESIRANNYPNLQHIFIDDCSPDINPKQVVKSWIKENDYICEFYEHDTNYGICKTLNHVLELTKGKYLIGCSDDKLLENRIHKDVEILEKLDESYALVHSKTEIIDKDSQLVNKFFSCIKMPADDCYFEKLLLGNFISAPSVTLVTNTIRNEGGYDESLLFEDYDIWLRLSKKGYKFKYLNKVNTQYRIHDKSASNSGEDAKKRRIIDEMRKIVLKYISENKHKIMYHDFQIIHKHNQLSLSQVLSSVLILIKINFFKFVYLKCVLKKVIKYNYK